MAACGSWDLDPRFWPPAVCFPASLPWGLSPSPRHSAPALSGLWSPLSEACTTFQTQQACMCDISGGGRGLRAGRSRQHLRLGVDREAASHCRARRGGLPAPELDCMREHWGPSWGAHPDDLIDSNHPPKAPSPDTITWEVRASTPEF